MMQSLGWFTNSNSFVKAKLHLIRRWHALTQYHDTIFAALCSQDFFFQICLVSRFRRNRGTTAQKTTNVVIMQCNRWECNLRGKRLGKNPTLISKSPSKRASSLKKEGMCALQAQRRFDLLQQWFVHLNLTCNHYFVTERPEFPTSNAIVSFCHDCKCYSYFSWGTILAYKLSTT